MKKSYNIIPILIPLRYKCKDFAELVVKYNDKYYLFAMNGQTGEFIGNMPVDKKKVRIYSIKMFLGVFVGIVALLYILYKLGVLL